MSIKKSWKDRNGWIALIRIVLITYPPDQPDKSDPSKEGSEEDYPVFGLGETVPFESAFFFAQFQK